MAPSTRAFSSDLDTQILLAPFQKSKPFPLYILPISTHKILESSTLIGSFGIRPPVLTDLPSHLPFQSSPRQIPCISYPPIETSRSAPHPKSEVPHHCLHTPLPALHDSDTLTDAWQTVGRKARDFCLESGYTTEREPLVSRLINGVDPLDPKTAALQTLLRAGPPWTSSP